MLAPGRSAHDEGDYRPDIDGLRAVAILSVLGYHAFPRALPGGFVGVDVFFVISGFLITGIILRGLARGTYTLSDFYARRIRRIFPALIVVLLAVWVLGWLKLLPDEYSGLTKHIAAGSVYASNLLLYREAGYFDTAASLKPLLHLWSLGVEEQFYILWPLVLVATWRWRAQLPVLVAITFASFALNVARIHAHPVSTFYLPATRLWELSMGGALACAQRAATERPPGAIREHAARIRALLAPCGIVLIAASLVLLDARRLFPGWWALAPAGGTLLIIAAGERSWLNRHALGCRAMVFIGLVSYPLYLWHWPLLSFTRIIEGDGVTTADLLRALGVAFVLSLLTYRFVELPARSARPAKRIATPLFAALAVIGLASYVTSGEGLDPLSARYGVRKILAAASELAFPGPHLRPLHTPWGTFLTQGAAQDAVLFIGDSNVEQYYPRIDAVLSADPEHTRRVIFATGGGCPPFPNVTEAHHPHCNDLVARAAALARTPLVRTIVIGAAWQGYLHDGDPRYAYYFEDGKRKDLITTPAGASEALSALDSLVRGFERNGKQVYVILQIPDENAFDPRSMFERSFRALRVIIRARPRLRSAVAARIAAIDSRLTEIAHRTGAIALDPLNAVCGTVLCPALDAHGVPIYRDTGHLRPSYVREHVRFLDALLRQTGSQ